MQKVLEFSLNVRRRPWKVWNFCVYTV